VNLTDIESIAAADNAAKAEYSPGAAATIVVCITCRRPGDPDAAPRLGATLAERTQAAADGTGLKFRRIKCLANCKRGCSAAIIREGGWAYVFGDLDETASAALIEGARLFARSSDGLMPWRGRPEPLKRGMIARVPPLTYEEAE
jgi:predicted metal-binding protein